ncbi:hypothetical protein RE6C_04087 [Rhodopirellula europaea 6C]|uniref:Uncharacterized protein n=1 Tax=Rhodopirellula europaea 6C TaxID=1263867 RepID=M2A563_9BACT|nr:hypothetical protein RE6C_04087 [Rhodopirellula europaea 6C]
MVVGTSIRRFEDRPRYLRERMTESASGCRLGVSPGFVLAEPRPTSERCSGSTDQLTQFQPKR